MQDFFLGTLFLGCLVGLAALMLFTVLVLTGAGIEKLSKRE